MLVNASYSGSPACSLADVQDGREREGEVGARDMEDRRRKFQHQVELAHNGTRILKRQAKEIISRVQKPWSPSRFSVNLQ